MYPRPFSGLCDLNLNSNYDGRLPGKVSHRSTLQTRQVPGNAMIPAIHSCVDPQNRSFLHRVRRQVSGRSTQYKMQRGLVLQLTGDATASLRQKFVNDDRNLEVVVSSGRTTTAGDRTTDLWDDANKESSSSSSAAPATAADGTFCLPVILIDPITLTGYLPTDDDHARAMVQSLRAVLFGATVLHKEDQRLLDLFSSKKARHGVSTSSTSTGKRSDYLVIPYPDFLRGNLSTRLVWTELHQPHEIAVVDRIFRRLASCHQPLLWKYDMKHEIQAIVEQETSFREVQEWKRRRVAELDQLYLVRETFVHRMELAQAEEANLLKERDRTIVENMKELHGLTSFDLHSTVFCFPDNTDDHKMMGFTTDDDELYFGKDEEDFGDDDDDQGSSWRQRRVNQQLAFIERTHTEQLREATLVEDRIREACTTTSLRVTMAKVSALKKKLEDVDGLLESLQDEQWAESETVGDPAGPQAEYPTARESVLTLILAMILGASDLSREPLMTEHASIVEEWESFFGRLPPLPNQRSNAEEEQERLDIVENDAGSWDKQSLEPTDKDSTNDEWSGCD